MTTIFNVECFDDSTDEWYQHETRLLTTHLHASIMFRYDAADMNVFRSALSACVLSGLTNIRNLITFVRNQTNDERQLIKPTIDNHDVATSLIPVGTLSDAIGTLTATIDNIMANN
jgi:hypothetical protein